MAHQNDEEKIILNKRKSDLVMTLDNIKTLVRAASKEDLENAEQDIKNLFRKLSK